MLEWGRVWLICFSWDFTSSYKNCLAFINLYSIWLTTPTSLLWLFNDVSQFYSRNCSQLDRPQIVQALKVKSKTKIMLPKSSIFLVFNSSWSYKATRKYSACQQKSTSAILVVFTTWGNKFVLWKKKSVKTNVIQCRMTHHPSARELLRGPGRPRSTFNCFW